MAPVALEGVPPTFAAGSHIDFALSVLFVPLGSGPRGADVRVLRVCGPSLDKKDSDLSSSDAGMPKAHVCGTPKGQSEPSNLILCGFAWAYRNSPRISNYFSYRIGKYLGSHMA